jgi:hypothetical protein
MLLAVLAKFVITVAAHVLLHYQHLRLIEAHRLSLPAQALAV